MDTDVCKYQHGTKSYQQVFLREAYQENGKTRLRTLLNLPDAYEDEIAGLRLAMKFKCNIP